ncbi:MAG: DUF1501 domain-containing protein [Tahibacter sp.]
MTLSASRREFLKLGLLSGVPLLAPALSFGQAVSNGAADRDVLVVIFQRGAMDGLNAVVPHFDPDYFRLRPQLALPRPGQGADAVLDLDGRYGLHPALAPLQSIYTQGRLAVVHAIGAPSGSRSHFSSQDLMERAVLALPSVSSGWLNRHLGSIGNSGIFQGIGIGTAVPRSLAGPAPVLGVNEFERFALDTHSARPDALRAALDSLHAHAQSLDTTALAAFSAIDGLAAADPAQFVAANGAAYPTTDFGRRLQQIAQLIKADIGLEVATVDIGGWDHHFDEASRLRPLLDDFARSLAAFNTDLGVRMSRVVVISMSEFGRRAYENASGGTDHGSGNCMFVMGGGVQGGRVYADWPGLADSSLVQGDLAITTDYRRVLSELLRKRRGETSLDHVFPDLGPAAELGVFSTVPT